MFAIHYWNLSLQFSQRGFKTAKFFLSWVLQPFSYELTSLALAASPLNPPILGDFNSISPLRCAFRWRIKFATGRTAKLGG
ncbi:hypothetical protein LYNGBM3L_67790 [Moorena producens 3L]|uniref:Uncharacterized protein n=1 Tax=Moorena producens 3L TaxID=489825 RepID=F4Y1D2_9CYAN|nr:hypothetical protein LYNGBM3L_67790 [Moorena producens 3L]OLT64075.1 hypothetical protein BI334_02675 [Moorena producens 3L]